MSSINKKELSETDICDLYITPAIIGEVGSKLRIHAIDDFKVKEVSVTIQNSDGTLVESGKAVLEPNGVTWLYTATITNPDLDGDKIIVRATDIPAI